MLRERNIDARLLHALHGAGDAGVEGATLCAVLGATPAQIADRVAELHTLGYQIDSGPHSGYRLVRTPNVLHADDLFARLDDTQIIGRDIRVFAETSSTNDLVEKLASDGVEEGVVVFAESQTKGRGRLGRQWASAPGAGLWFSILLRPAIPPQATTRFTIATATALARAIEKFAGVSPEIKWPNDLLHEGKKLAGILTEMSAELDRVRHVILGIGLNVNQIAFPTELRDTATSLRMVVGREIDRPALAAAILRELDRDYARIIHGDFAAISEEWEARCGTVGKRVRIQCGERIISGACESLDADGALLVRTQHGMLERVLGGDVTVLKG